MLYMAVFGHMSGSLMVSSGAVCSPSPGVLPLDGGWIFYIVNRPPLAGGLPLAIMFHGFTGSHIESGRLYTDLAYRLCRAGITAVRFDYRGHGDSSGLFEEFSLEVALEDAELMVRHSLGLSGVDPSRVALVGLSLGGYIALKMFEKFREAVRSLVLLAPAIRFSRPPSTWAPSIGGYIYIPDSPYRLRFEFAAQLALDAMHIADMVDIPVLLIHSKDDRVFPYEVSLEWFNRIPSRDKKILLPEKGGHVFNDYHVREEIYGEVVEWLKRRLS